MQARGHHNVSSISCTPRTLRTSGARTNLIPSTVSRSDTEMVVTSKDGLLYVGCPRKHDSQPKDWSGELPTSSSFPSIPARARGLALSLTLRVGTVQQTASSFRCVGLEVKTARRLLICEIDCKQQSRGGPIAERPMPSRLEARDRETALRSLGRGRRNFRSGIAFR